MDNQTIARQLMGRARYLVDRNASLYRVRAYRQAAETVLGLDEPLESIVSQRGRRGLQELPGIGPHIARTLETLVRTGTLPTLREGKRRKPQGERSEPWGSGARSCNASATSSR